MIVRFLTLLLCALPLAGAEAIIQDRVEFSQIFEETRNFRIFLPPNYEHSGKRYPVVYWFHGYSERFNKPVDDPPNRNYDSGTDYGGDNIANYVGAHDVIVVKWDGYNPRFAGDNYPRPYNVGPVETSRQFPLYFPELVDFIDANFRTIADRDHRGVTGFSMGGFMAYWIAGKYPQLVSSASSFMGSPEFFVRPARVSGGVPSRRDVRELRRRAHTAGHRLARFHPVLSSRIERHLEIRARLARDRKLRFRSRHAGHRQDSRFHMNAFAHPLPRPAVWNHADVYPNFTVWGWEVASDRKQPGFTQLPDWLQPSGSSSVA